jgi:hypothetical protein
VTDVRTRTATTGVPARLDRLPWIKTNPRYFKTNPRYYCAVLFSALVGTPRQREDS